MKNRILLLLMAGVLFNSACEKKLKEHPLPESLKQKIIKQSDPAVKAKEISGTITVDQQYANSIPNNARLFIIARPEGVSGGPPLAVKRHSLVEFPFNYTIGPSDVMLEGNPFEGAIALKVRIDQDGNAQASPGDIEGETLSEAGAKQVDIVLNKIIAPGKNSVSGTLRIDPKLAKNLPDTWKLFLFARPQGATAGPPLAVKLLDSVQFPYPFTLGQENVMMPGSVFEGEMTLIARIDHDGDARSSPDDLAGVTTVTAGDQQVEIVIDRRVGG
ncbi:MAG: hypothetical protein NPINA01_18320 [Nitrospinaceae bacterium]|nr:MAG: hypothetical protein NPINA01_18320 [Nitrospinaceae bacterium]